MKLLGKLLSICVLLMIAISFITIVIHYLFNIVSIPMQELINYLHSLIFMLGIVYTHHFDKHVRIDIFYQNKTSTNKEKLNKIGTVLLLLPFFIFILIVSFQYVGSSWLILEKSSETGGLPFVYLFKSLILILPTIMILYAINNLKRKG